MNVAPLLTVREMAPVHAFPVKLRFPPEQRDG